MKKSLSLRAMLIGLFVTAVPGTLTPAAAGFLSNQRLIDLRYNQIAQQISRIHQALASIEGAVGATPAQQESAGQLEDVVTELN